MQSSHSIKIIYVDLNWMMAPYSNLQRRRHGEPEGLPGFPTVSIWGRCLSSPMFKGSEKSSRFYIITELKSQSNPFYLLLFSCVCVHMCVRVYVLECV